MCGIREAWETVEAPNFRSEEPSHICRSGFDLGGAKSVWRYGHPGFSFCPEGNLLLVCRANLAAGASETGLASR